MKTPITASVVFLLMSSSVQAIDLTYGKGDFDIGMSMSPFISSNVTLDIDTISITERHKNIRDSKYYYHFKLDYFDSNTVNKMTDIAKTPLTTSLPILGSSIDDYIDKYTKVPVPTDYRIHGIDFDIGLGYDFLNDEKNTLGVSVNTGISAPFMKMRNIEDSAKLFLKGLSTFDTKIKTYKFGVSVYAQHNLNDQFTISANGSYDLQTGEMDNDLVGSGIDVDGSYLKLDLNAKYYLKNYKHWYLTGGYTYNKWDYDSMEVNVPLGSFKVPRDMDIDFESNNFYLGVGYNY